MKIVLLQWFSKAIVDVRESGIKKYKKVNKSADKKIIGDINVHCWRTNG
jgi:hypothetical protein